MSYLILNSWSANFWSPSHPRKGFHWNFLSPAKLYYLGPLSALLLKRNWQEGNQGEWLAQLIRSTSAFQLIVRIDFAMFSSSSSSVIISVESKCISERKLLVSNQIREEAPSRLRQTYLAKLPDLLLSCTWWHQCFGHGEPLGDDSQIMFISIQLLHLRELFV